MENRSYRKPPVHILGAFRRHGTFVHHAYRSGTLRRKYGPWAFCAVLRGLLRLPQHGRRNPLDRHCRSRNYGTF